jgi:hypothetical protein
MDAVIMDGETLNAGGIACVQNIKNPIDLARLVMDKVRKSRKWLTEAFYSLSNIYDAKT